MQCGQGTAHGHGMVHGQGMAQAGAQVRTRGHEGRNGAAQGLGPRGREGDRLSQYQGREGCHAHSTLSHSSWASWVPGCTLVSGRQGGTSEGQQGVALDVLRMDWGWDA